MTIANLIGLGRFPEEVLQPLLQLQLGNVALAASLGACIAVGSDAGAYAVYHGQGCEDEAKVPRDVLGEDADRILRRGEEEIRRRF